MGFKHLLMLLNLLLSFLLTTNLVELNKIRGSHLKVCDSQILTYVNKTKKVIFESCMVPMKQSKKKHSNLVKIF